MDKAYITFKTPDGKRGVVHPSKDGTFDFAGIDCNYDTLRINLPKETLFNNEHDRRLSEQAYTIRTH